MVTIPVTTIPITSAQVMLVTAIAWISGRELGMKSGGELFAALDVNVGASFALRELARTLISAAPGVGTLISAGMAFAGTMAIGAAARAYE